MPSLLSMYCPFCHCKLQVRQASVGSVVFCKNCGGKIDVQKKPFSLLSCLASLLLLPVLCCGGGVFISSLVTDEKPTPAPRRRVALRPATQAASEPVKAEAEPTLLNAEAEPPEQTALAPPSTAPGTPTNVEPANTTVVQELPPTPEVRTWTSGKFTTDATFVSYTDGKVRLRKPSGTEVTVPLKRLSDEDQRYVAEITRDKSLLPIQVIEGKVISVADGDTLSVLQEINGSKTSKRIRLEGIDAPESGQAYANKAKRALQEKVLLKVVRVEWKELDQYGRILGHVYIDDHHVNVELVEEGWAWHFVKYSDSKELAAAEISARAAKVGLWQDVAPTPPWEFRDNRPAKVVQQKERPPPAPKARARRVREPKPEQPSPDPIVYVTRTGEKYHTAGCRYLRQSSIPMRLSEAKRTHSPCSVCDPPG